MSPRIIGVTLAAAASLGLGACSTYDDHRYGYSRVSVGVGYGAPYYGWYDGFYYPGTGYYIYDRGGYRHRWSSRHRDYWVARRSHDRRYADNWTDYGVQHRYRDQRGRDYDDRDRRYRDDRGHAREDRREHSRDDRRSRERDDRNSSRDRRTRDDDDRRSSRDRRGRDRDDRRDRRPGAEV